MKYGPLCKYCGTSIRLASTPDGACLKCGGTKIIGNLIAIYGTMGIVKNIMDRFNE